MAEADEDPLTAGEVRLRAFEVQRDLGATDRALSSGLSDEDLVYVALWFQLVNRALHVQPDPLGAQALASIRDDGRWVGRLARWGLGRIKDAELLASARTVSQKTEATFYLAVARAAAGDAAGSQSGLRDVVKSTAIDLVEVQLARDLLAGPERNLAGPAPVAVPSGDARHLMVEQRKSSIGTGDALAACQSRP
jgi:hypothetical protein